jgi:hypothetical protein
MDGGGGPDGSRDEAPLDAVARLHATPHRMVYAFAGAGSRALAWLHAVGGSHRTVLEAHDHYHPASLAEALGATPETAVAPAVAEGLAVASRTRARRLVAADDPPGPAFGLGLTATIATDRRKRGEHRIELASADALGVRGASFVLSKGARDRAGEEGLVGRWLLALAAEASGLLGWADPPLREDEPLAHRFRPDEAFRAFLDDPDALLALGPDGRPAPLPEGEPAPALVSGSFHPMHEGHRRLAEAAEAHLGRPAWFEMPIENADKDAMAPVEARRRAAQAYGVRRLLLTHAPLFAEKAERLPGCVFVVGVDTARRVLAPRFYGGEEGLRRGLRRIRAAGSRFLVAGRAGEEGFRTLADLTVPEAFADLFEPLPSFRVDLSSTELRADWPATVDP